MDYLRHGRTILPVGAIFDNSTSAAEFTENFELEPVKEKLSLLEFSVDQEAYLKANLAGSEYFVSYFALKEICKMLKIPANFINKFTSSHLVLENLNKNPYLTDDQHLYQFVIWKWEDKNVLAGILPIDASYIACRDILKMMQDYDAFSRPETKLDSIVLNGEEMVIYFLLPEDIKKEGFSFNGGFAFHFSSARSVDTRIFPFYNMAISAKTGELFDFDFESNKLIHNARRRKKDFEEVTYRLATEYLGEDLGIDFDNNLKRGLVAQNTSSLKFSTVKSLKSRATSVYSYLGMKIKSGAVIEEIIPEYKSFVDNNREDLKNKESYEINTMLLDFYLPLYYNRLFTFHSSFENPYFYIRYRQSIGKIFDKIMEETGDIHLAE